MVNEPITDRKALERMEWELYNLPENSDYPCRNCPSGKTQEKAKECASICQSFREWVDNRLKNARIKVYGTEEVHELRKHRRNHRQVYRKDPVKTKSK